MVKKRTDSDDLARAIARVRHFTRFYTRRIGVLEENLLMSAFSLTEGRVLWELGQRDQLTATVLARELGVDLGYISRILRSFAQRGLVTKHPSGNDGRQNLLTLTRAGRKAYEDINLQSKEEIGAILAALSPEERQRLTAAMKSIEQLLQPDAERDD